jgi:hypothetical protein
MDYRTAFSLKLLRQIIKRSLTKAFYIWLLSESSQRSQRSLEKSSMLSQFSPIKKQMINKYKSVASNLDINHRKETPIAVRKSKPTSPVNCSFFDQIKSSLQLKAGNAGEAKNMEGKEEGQNRDGKRREEYLERGFFGRHKKTNTMPVVDLAVVSSKCLRNTFKINATGFK